MDSYSRTIDFLYSQTPQFQQIGAAAYKPGLDTVRALADAFGNPQNRLKTIHIAGTNGKGSTAHSIASCLQEAGYKVGLFTSPHLIDFRERIRINGAMIPKEEVTAFVDRFRTLQSAGKADGNQAAIKRSEGSALEPSFFELTTVMAFDWFARSNVDYAVIEVGLGGRLDSTNIITPLLSVITNISFDHIAQLGNTLEAIASEKAGIIKSGIPVVIGEAEAGEEANGVREVFVEKARQCGAPISFACDDLPACNVRKIRFDNAEYLSADTSFGQVKYELTGSCQEKNLQTIVEALSKLFTLLDKPLTHEAVQRGLQHVVENTGLRGRWMKVVGNPLTICDTGHNIGGWQYLSKTLNDYPGELVMIIGFVNDKDISHILPLMPRRARYIFTRASVPRALPSEDLAARAADFGLTGATASTVADALRIAHSYVAADTEQGKENHDKGASPMIFVGGSTFVVADLLAALPDYSGRTE